MKRAGTLLRAQTGLTLRPATGPQEWTRHERASGATVFHSWGWLSWIAPLTRCRFVPLLVQHEGETVGIAPMLLRPHRGAQTANLAPFPYLGPVVAPALMGPTAALLRQWGTRHRVVRGKQVLGPTAQVAPGCFSPAGLAEEVDQTYLVDLEGRSEQEILKSFSKDVGNALRRSVKNGVSIRTSTPDDLRQVLPLVHAQALGRTDAYVSRVGDSLASGPPPFPVRCATAVIDGREVGLSIALGGAGAVGWIGSVFRDDQGSQANTALIWDAIRWAHASGYRTMDMLRAPSPGIAAYKQKFRPRVVDYQTGNWQLPGVDLAEKTVSNVLQPAAVRSAVAVKTVRDRMQRGAKKAWSQQSA